MTKTVDLDWNNLGFRYIKTDYRYISYYKDGQWDNGALVEDNVLHISDQQHFIMGNKHLRD